MNDQEMPAGRKIDRLLSLLTSPAKWARGSYRTQDGAMNLAAAVFQAETGTPYPIPGSQSVKAEMVRELDNSGLARAIVKVAMRRGLVAYHRSRRINDLAAIESKVVSFAELRNLLESLAQESFSPDSG